MNKRIHLLLLVLLLIGCQKALAQRYDILIRGGDVYDGSGAGPVKVDIAIQGDRIVKIATLIGGEAKQLIHLPGLAIAPGFINMLSWSTESLLISPASLGEVYQGVTTQIMGEGESMGPWTPAMRQRRIAEQGDLKYLIEWTTLAEYLKYLEKKQIAQNVASYIGATTLREHVIGLEDKAPTPAQMEEMRKLVRQEMEAGALGIGSALIYPPAFYAKTEELIELCKVAALYQGKYISHLRSEGNRLLEAVEELIRISREANIPAEIYHLKASGEANWPKMDQVIQRIEKARAEGLKISADMYTYTAGSTGLTAIIPPWAQDGGPAAMIKRLKDPVLRARIAKEIAAPAQDWENFYTLVGSPDRILLIEFKKEALKSLQGKTLAEAAKLRRKDPIQTAIDLLIEDETRIGAIYFMISEENIKKQIRLPWVSFGSDAASMSPAGVFLKFKTHPRAYGNFARLLGKYVREEKVIPLGEAIRRLTSLPAQNLGLDRRGLIKEGYFADIVAFDPKTIADRATYQEPHQLAVGMKYVLVNGKAVIDNGEVTGLKPGRALWGPGKRR